MTNKVKQIETETTPDVTLKAALSWAWLLGFHQIASQWSGNCPEVPEEGGPLPRYSVGSFYRVMNFALQDGTRVGGIHKAKEILMLEKQRVAAKSKVKDTKKKPNVSQKKTKKKG